MDKKEDVKKPSKKDKKKKDKKKKDIKKISKSQIVKQSVNIKIGDLSKPRTRTRRAAPKAPPAPPQIQRQLQYLPSLAGQAPMIPPPLTPAPPPPRPPAPPPAPAEPRRTGDFFSDDTSSGFGLGSRFGSSYDLGSAPGELEQIGTLSRSSSRPTLSQYLRPRSNSEISLLTDFTGDLENVSFLSDATYQEPTPSIPTQPEESLGAGADFENIAAPSVVNIADNLGFVSSQQPQEIQQLQPTQTPPEAQPIEAQLVQEPIVAVPVEEDPRISEPLQEQPQPLAVKGDIKPEDEPTGGGIKESIIFSELSDKKLSNLFKIFDNERIPMQLTQADAIERYNLIKKTGGLIGTPQFSKAYVKYKKQQGAAAEE